MKYLIRIIFIIFIITGLLLIINDKLYAYKKLEKENKQIEEFFIKETKQNIKTKEQDTYIGIIEIPKINLKKGFYNINSVHNIISENVTIIKQEKNTIVFAAHSGNSHISYFKDLYKLQEKDLIYLYLNNKKYEYRIVKHYEEDKDGDINIKDNSDNKKVILTTCKSFDKQLVYIAYLKERKSL